MSWQVQKISDDSQNSSENSQMLGKSDYSLHFFPEILREFFTISELGFDFRLRIPEPRKLDNFPKMGSEILDRHQRR